MSLAQKLSKRILKDGPLSLDEFMGAALGDREFGYYMTRDPFGARGDFITAPEISQVFGELIGLWCAAFWLQIESPATVHLVELGPGRGTLMKDALRAIKSVPEFAKSLEVHLVEMSPVLQKIQSETLEECGYDIHWHTHIEDLPEGVTITLANEFFDALPIRQFIRAQAGWCERLVALNSKDQFEFSTSPEAMPPEQVGINPELVNSPIDSIVETCQPAQTIIKALSRRLQAYGGAALIIDYGYLKSEVGETLQAVSDHRFADILQNPGEQDLTAHVDFSALAQSAQGEGAKSYGPIQQGQFLQALGLDIRIAKLTNATTPAQTYDIKTAARRLTAEDQMGTLFKVMAITAQTSEAPLPFI